jgi:hypothetical protein
MFINTGGLEKGCLCLHEKPHNTFVTEFSNVGWLALSFRAV